MQRFIDECNEAVDMFQRCANGWENLEQEMIDSVDSFADRIVFTEGLILQVRSIYLLIFTRANHAFNFYIMRSFIQINIFRKRI